MGVNVMRSWVLVLLVSLANLSLVACNDDDCVHARASVSAGGYTASVSYTGRCQP
jgi:hypothetical protein